MVLDRLDEIREYGVSSTQGLRQAGADSGSARALLCPEDRRGERHLRLVNTPHVRFQVIVEEPRWKIPHLDLGNVVAHRADVHVENAVTFGERGLESWRPRQIFQPDLQHLPADVALDHTDSVRQCPRRHDRSRIARRRGRTQCQQAQDRQHRRELRDLRI